VEVHQGEPSGDFSPETAARGGELAREPYLGAPGTYPSAGSTGRKRGRSGTHGEGRAMMRRVGRGLAAEGWLGGVGSRRR